VKLIAHIEIEQEIQPASFGTVHAYVEQAIERALADLEMPHRNGLAVINGAAVTIHEPLEEWRVCTKMPQWEGPLTERAETEQAAREWADLERADYPHAEIWIERRNLGTWERV
jgi:hypothetical protein